MKSNCMDSRHDFQNIPWNWNSFLDNEAGGNDNWTIPAVDEASVAVAIYAEYMVTGGPLNA